MPQAAARAHIEALLRARKLENTLTSAAPWTAPSEDLAATGIPAIDAALGGGLRRGHVSEIVGPRSTGRTTVVCRLLAEAAARGEALALIDTSDRFDPAAAAAAGVELSRVLWVRPDIADPARALKAANLVLQAGGFGLVVFDLADVPTMALRQFPCTTWMRIARTIEGSQTVAVVVAAERLARSPGGVTIAFDATPGASRGRWAGVTDRARVLHGVDIQPRIISHRTAALTGHRTPLTRTDRGSEEDVRLAIG